MKPIGRNLGERAEAQIVELKEKLSLDATSVIRMAVDKLAEAEGVRVDVEEKIRRKGRPKTVRGQ